jgi:hypothetical protein
MRSVFWLGTPALLCLAVATTIAAPQVTSVRESSDRVGSALVSHVDDNLPPIIGSRDVAQGREGRGASQQQQSDRIRQDFRRRHDAEAAVRPLAGSLRVRASVPWTNARLMVRKGQLVSFETVGTVFFSLDEGATAGPDGTASSRRNSRLFPVPGLGVCGLIFRVGNGPAFPIGSNSRPIVMPANGQLYLGINDSEFNDNSGFFRVRARIVNSRR